MPPPRRGQRAQRVWRRTEDLNKCSGYVGRVELLTETAGPGARIDSKSSTSMTLTIWLSSFVDARCSSSLAAAQASFCDDHVVVPIMGVARGRLNRPCGADPSKDETNAVTLAFSVKSGGAREVSIAIASSGAMYLNFDVSNATASRCQGFDCQTVSSSKWHETRHTDPGLT